MKAAVYYKTGPPDVLQYEDVADPVCADVAVRAEQLDHVQGRRIRVEDRDRVLVAIRDVDVLKARLQRLKSLLPRSRGAACRPP